MCRYGINYLYQQYYLPGWYQNCITSRILLFGGYLKVRELFYTRLLFGSIPFCLIDTRMIVPTVGTEVLKDLNDIENRNILKYPYPM